MSKREFLDIVFALAPNEANAIMDAFDEYVDSNEPHWIPATERLPKKNGRYYVTEWIYGMDDKRHNGKHWVKTDIAEYSVEEKRWIRGTFIEVVAWMNDEPYKGVTT